MCGNYKTFVTSPGNSEAENSQYWVLWEKMALLKTGNGAVRATLAI